MDIILHKLDNHQCDMTTPTASTSATNTNQSSNKNYKVIQQLYPLREEKNGLIREVGGIATWSLSSSKSGFGVEQLRDNCVDTYWQSDGPQPHLVNISFTRKITIKVVCMYVDYTLDESYTPYKISIRAGSSYFDLQEIEQIEMDKPTGWVMISLKDGNDAPVRACHIQIAVLGNHQNGRDTHLRQVKIYSPVNNGPISAVSDVPNGFSTLSMTQHCSLRLQNQKLFMDFVEFEILTPNYSG